MKLKDKIIVITGGSGLIGKGIVSVVESEGAICINADISTAMDIGSGTAKMDTTSKESVTEVINSIMAKYGKIDGWVNNAYPRTKDWGAKLEDVLFESWRSNVDMQMNSYFLCCQEVSKIMIKQQYGSVINIASTYGIVAPDFTTYDGTTMTSPAAYSAIKGGVINMTKYFASYFGKYNVRFNCVSPGGIFDNQNPVFVANYEKKVPLKRMGKPGDIAPSVAFLLSDDAGYITGHNLVVDGGWTVI